MSDAFEDREKGYEAKFKLDEELVFKIRARQNKLLGLWIAKHFGFDEGKSLEYAKDVVIADMDEPGIDDVIRKVMADINARGVDLSEIQVREKLASLEKIAVTEVTKET